MARKMRTFVDRIRALGGRTPPPRRDAPDFAEAARIAGIDCWELDLASGRLAWSGACAPWRGAAAATRESWIAALHSGDRARLRAAIEACIARGAPLDLRHRVLAPGGAVRWLWVRGGTVRAADGTPVRLAGIARDITREHAIEAEIRRARDEAERAGRAQARFLSAMSHELRTPLNAVLGFAQLLKSEPGQPLDDRRGPYVDHILDGGCHLLELINRILDWSKVESGRASLAVEDVEVGPVLDECQSLVKSMAAARAIAVIDDTAAARHATVRADRTRLKQVLLNLLSNAVKYNRDGGRIELSARLCAGARLRITIADTGLGIPPARRREVFEPFSRLGAETGAVEGTGIGLTICRRLVSMMGGAMDFDSIAGAGSRFWFELPLAQPRDRAPASPGSDGRYRVLYIDGNATDVRLMERILALVPRVELTVAYGPEDGLARARAERPDALLADIAYAAAEGDDGLAALRAEPGLSDVPVIAVGAGASAAGGARVCARLAKPVRVEAVLEVVNALLRA